MDLAAVVERIERRLKAVGKSAAGASQEAGLSADAIRNMKRALKTKTHAGASGTTLAALAPVLQTTVAWLVEEAGPEDVDAPPPRERTKGQRVLHVPADQVVVPGGIKLPVYSGAQGGKGKLIIGSDIVDRVEMPAVLKDVQGAYGLMIDGSSMEPEFWPGDIAWVHPHLRPMRGKNHILYHTPPFGDDAEAIIKRVNGWNDREWDLEQWNPAKKFKEFRQEWPICHRVVGKYDAA